jgi:hypothetical protein
MAHGWSQGACYMRAPAVQLLVQSVDFRHPDERAQQIVACRMVDYAHVADRQHRLQPV